MTGYTYCHESLGQRKLNDHFIVSQSLLDNGHCFNHQIIEDGNNPSDHLPISMTIRLTVQPNKSDKSVHLDRLTSNAFESEQLTEEQFAMLKLSQSKRYGISFILPWENVIPTPFGDPGNRSTTRTIAPLRQLSMGVPPKKPSQTLSRKPLVEILSQTTRLKLRNWMQSSRANMQNLNAIISIHVTATAIRSQWMPWSTVFLPWKVENVLMMTVSTLNIFNMHLYHSSTDSLSCSIECFLMLLCPCNFVLGIWSLS